MNRRRARISTSGMTLVEVLVALAVFSVIGTAAFAMLDQTLRSERLAGTRLERLTQVQRTMRILSIDTMQAISGTVKDEPSGISFLRRGALRQGGEAGVEGLFVRYAVDGGRLLREVGAPGADLAQQVLLPQVTAAEWHLIQGGAVVPPDARTDAAEGVEFMVTLPGDQTLRGVFPVPHDLIPQASP